MGHPSIQEIICYFNAASVFIRRIATNKQGNQITISSILKKRIAILGSTGSIGRQALEVVDQHPGRFSVEILTALNQAGLLIEQAIRYKPNAVVIGHDCLYNKVSEALSPYQIKVFAGEEALSQIVEMETIDMVLIALVGFAGLKPTLSAIHTGKRIALANKESLVVAGELITSLAVKTKAEIIPVDSEHSAIFQCLMGEDPNQIEKVYLTASGGPFRKNTLKELEKVTKEQALNHPNWNMGDKITIDSATLMNKGFEVIEAKWLFGLSKDQIEVVIHPQSVIHSLVQFSDGSMKAQMGLPDMRLPIQFAFGFPHRLPNAFPRFNFSNFPDFSFEKPDLKIFRNLALAFYALDKGGNMPCILNAANEMGVQAFLHNKVSFTEIPNIVEAGLEQVAFIENPSIGDYGETDRETRVRVTEYIKRVKN
jgi:1-deoxy-D-xylulose-5-phosphate reductoisomerase